MLLPSHIQNRRTDGRLPDVTLNINRQHFRASRVYCACSTCSVALELPRERAEHMQRARTQDCAVRRWCRDSRSCLADVRPSVSMAPCLDQAPLATAGSDGTELFAAEVRSHVRPASRHDSSKQGTKSLVQHASPKLRAPDSEFFAIEAAAACTCWRCHLCLRVLSGLLGCAPSVGS